VKASSLVFERGMSLSIQAQISINATVRKRPERGDSKPTGDIARRGREKSRPGSKHDPGEGGRAKERRTSSVRNKQRGGKGERNEKKKISEGDIRFQKEVKEKQQDRHRNSPHGRGELI